MLPRRPRSRRITTRLYAAGAIALVGVTALAIAAVHFAVATTDRTRTLYKHEFAGVTAAGNLQLLLERHRRLIEAAPVAMDREQIDTHRAQSEEILDGIQAQIREREGELIARLAAELPVLADQGRRVLYLAANYAQEEAIEAAEKYCGIADRARALIERYQQSQTDAANEKIERLTALGAALVEWVVLGCAIVFLAIGPLSLWHIRSAVRRLNRIAGAMLRLARNEPVDEVRDCDADDEIGDLARALAVFKSNAETLNAQRDELGKLNAWLDVALNNMARGLSMFDSGHRLILCNRRFAELYGLSPDRTVPGTHVDELWQETRYRRSNDNDAESWEEERHRRLREVHPFTLSRVLDDGRIISVAYQPLRDGGWVAVHEDVTDRRAAQAREERLARIDALTGIANRLSFREALEQAFAGLDTAGRGFAVHWLDLDGFKEVNDQYGHPAGDSLLREIARRLAGDVRTGDVIARLGGDEFAVIQSAVAASSETSAMCRRLIRSISQPIEISGASISVGVSIGTAIAPEMGATVDELLANADVALYRAKSEGKGRHVVYHADIEQGIRERKRLAMELRNAIACGELELHYQPILDLRTRRVLMLEALMRWRHAERGLVSPGLFIPLAEEIGAIGALGRLALRKAAATASRLPADIKVAVNVSAAQFAAGDVVADLEEALAASGVAATRIEIEVTESVLLETSSSTLEMLHRLRGLGATIALDDFGTGYSSLSYLRRFPFDKIKIDQSFVRDLLDRVESQAIVRSVTQLARDLGMKTVAEGVETHASLDCVLAAGCDEVQGYLFSPPVPESELAKVLARLSGAAGLAA